MNILITGLSGLIGGLLGKELSPRHRVRGLSRSRVAGYEHVSASITDYAAILPAFRDIDVVVHLAAFRADDPIDDLLRTNIDGTYNVFRAAAENGVRRVVFASSGGVIRGYLNDLSARGSDAFGNCISIDADSVPRPVRPYDATKVAGESIARVFHESVGLESVCIRAGKCVADDIPVQGLVRPLWVSQRDITQLLARCVEHPGPIGFEIIYGVSANTPPFVDIGRTERIFGYKAQDGCSWESTGQSSSPTAL